MGIRTHAIVIGLLASAVIALPPPPASAAIIATGTFSGPVNVTCYGSGGNFYCNVSIWTITQCVETYAGTPAGLQSCSLYFTGGDPQVIRGTASSRNLSCTASTSSLRSGDTLKPLVVRSPSVGDTEVSPQINYGASAASGHGTVNGTRQALAYTLVVAATITNVLGCGQDSGTISGTYTISQ